MKNIYLIAVCLISGSLLAGCGSAPTGAANAASNTAPAANSNSAGVLPGGANSNSVVIGPGESIPGITAPGKAANIDVNAPGDANLAMASKRRITDVPGQGPSGPPPTRPAGENSTYSATMAADGSFLETRVFSGDQSIAKIEKTSNGAKQAVRIFLKSGRVVSVPASKVESVNTVALATIKSLAGIKETPKPLSPEEKAAMDKKMKQ